MLAEIGKAASERMSPRIDDLRVRQDQLDKRNEHPVVGQLVDEERAIGSPLDRGALQIFLAGRPPLFGIETDRGGGVISPSASDCRQVRKLGRPFNQAV